MKRLTANTGNGPRTCWSRLNDLSCIDPIRNHSFRDNTLAHRVNLAIKGLLKANFKKECPDCAEIIKAQAKKCLHCGREF